MDPRVLRRFIIIGAIATFVAFSGWTVAKLFLYEEPGDYYTREGDIRLGDGRYDEAIESFNKALAEMPNHRGALMGRALVFMRTGKAREAEAELSQLIDFLTKTLKPDDRTGIGVLAAAYANRGILNDRAGRYHAALADYIAALKTDAGVLDGPGLFDKILYGTPRPSTVRDRAIYLKEQLALPPEKRLLRVPEIDAQQRMHKP
ncbi:MAG: tetratricopeptide repeat protein [Alphaproteobacteria bacterium]|nr:tetratricopeptide repeat protein [Alphaproteobacteria bacterium]